MTDKQVIKKLESLASHNPKDLEGMAHFGINVDKAWVISIPKLRGLASEVRKEVFGSDRHTLALEVWKSDIHEAKILAGFIDDPVNVTEEQMEDWVLGFDSWDVTDMVIGNLFDRSEFAVQKAREWSVRPEEYVKRAGFVLMAGLATHNKTMSDEQFVEFLDIIKRQAGDSRNFVRKSINWALRTIGKARNNYLYNKAMDAANEILKQVQDDVSGGADGKTTWTDAEKKAARWIARDAIRELEKDYITKRFR